MGGSERELPSARDTLGVGVFWYRVHRTWGTQGAGHAGHGRTAAHGRTPEARVTLGAESRRPVRRDRPARCRARGAQQDCALAPTRWFPEPGSSRSLHCGCAAEGWGWGGRQGSFAPPVRPPPSFASRAARPRGQKTGMEWRLANRSRLKARAAGERGGAGRGSWPGFFQTEPGVP